MITVKWTLTQFQYLQLINFESVLHRTSSILFKIFAHMWQSKQYETKCTSRTARLQKRTL